jgi:hypothetical protein
MQYTAAELLPCVLDVVQVVRNSVGLKTQAIRKKYSYARFSEVSKTCTVENIQIP